MKKRGTYKSCPGCGGTDWRPVGKVCPACRRNLDFAKQVKEKNKSLLDTETYRAFVPPQDMEKDWRRLLTGIAYLVSAPTEDCFSSDNFLLPVDAFLYPATAREQGSYGNHGVRLPKIIAEAIGSLAVRFHQIEREEYQRGVRDGGRVLRRLMQGDVSVFEYNERTGQSDIK